MQASKNGNLIWTLINGHFLVNAYTDTQLTSCALIPPYWKARLTVFITQHLPFYNKYLPEEPSDC